MHKARVAQFEICARDGELLERFYASLFGWRVRGDGGRARVAYRTEPDGTAMESVISEAGQNGVTPYVEVNDVVENLCYAEELGGRIIELPHEIVSGGRCVTVAVFADPEGNHVGLSNGFDRSQS